MNIKTVGPKDRVVPERNFHELKKIRPSRGRFFHISRYFTAKEIKDPETDKVIRVIQIPSAGSTYRKPKVEVAKNVVL